MNETINKSFSRSGVPGRFRVDYIKRFPSQCATWSARAYSIKRSVLIKRAHMHSERRKRRREEGGSGHRRFMPSCQQEPWKRFRASLLHFDFAKPTVRVFFRRSRISLEWWNTTLARARAHARSLARAHTHTRRGFYRGRLASSSSCSCLTAWIFEVSVSSFPFLTWIKWESVVEGSVCAARSKHAKVFPGEEGEARWFLMRRAGERLWQVKIWPEPADPRQRSVQISSHIFLLPCVSVNSALFMWHSV